MLPFGKEHCNWGSYWSWRPSPHLHPGFGSGASPSFFWNKTSMLDKTLPPKQLGSLIHSSNFEMVCQFWGVFLQVPDENLVNLIVTQFWSGCFWFSSNPASMSTTSRNYMVGFRLIREARIKTTKLFKGSSTQKSSTDHKRGQSFVWFLVVEEKWFLSWSGLWSILQLASIISAPVFVSSWNGLNATGFFVFFAFRCFTSLFFLRVPQNLGKQSFNFFIVLRVDVHRHVQKGGCASTHNLSLSLSISSCLFWYFFDKPYEVYI